MRPWVMDDEGGPHPNPDRYIVVLAESADDAAEYIKNKMAFKVDGRSADSERRLKLVLNAMVDRGIKPQPIEPDDSRADHDLEPLRPIFVGFD